MSFNNKNRGSSDQLDVFGPISSLVLFTRAFGNRGTSNILIALVIIFWIARLFDEYVYKPYFYAKAYLWQFFGQQIPADLAYATIPGFIVLIFVAMIASLVVWSISRFNKYPNYASRAIIGFSIAMLIILKLYDKEIYRTQIFSVFGPMTLGYRDHMFILFFTLLFGLLCWFYFASSKFFRFRRMRKQEESKDIPTAPNIIKLEKISTAAFLNRRVNKGFFLILLVLAFFDPNFWPDIPFETRFWSGTEFNPKYDPPEAQYYANLNATPSDILHTIATYLFIAYFVITLQVRAVRRLHFHECYAGYIPPYYVYGLAVVGGFCAAVFAFVPYNYMGKENHILQAIGPLIYFSVSLFRTGRQYYKYIATIESQTARTGVEFDTKKSLVFYFSSVFAIFMIGVLYIYSIGLNVSFNNDDIRVLIDKELPIRFKDGVFRDVTEFTLLPNTKTSKESDKLENKFVMKMRASVRVNKQGIADRFVNTFLTLNGNLVFDKHSNNLTLENVELVSTNIDKLVITESELKNAGKRDLGIIHKKGVTIKEWDIVKKKLKYDIRRHYNSRSQRFYPVPKLFSPLINKVKFDTDEIKMQLKLG